MSKIWTGILVSIALIGICMMMQRSNADEVVALCQYQFDNYKIISLLDGQIDFPLKNIIKDNTTFDHPYFHAAQDASIKVPINVFLIDTDSQKILFDVGLAGMFHSKTGKLEESLKQAGYASDQITAICITHFHPDHIGGLLHADGTKAFAHADLFVAQAEVDYWLNSSDHASITSLVNKAFSLYTVHKVVPGQKILDNLTVVATPGHSAGHISFLCDTGQKKVLIWGDIMHMPELQFAHPGISFLDDTNAAQAILTRKYILQQALQQGWIVAGVHLVSPGIGTISDLIAGQNSYQWLPLNPSCSS
jgi:glyoxylase-like metal-dependent hydrolase (beta-lactamase superfamily II)